MNLPATLRAVIFDLDGLMLDTESIARIAWQQAGVDSGYPIPDDLFLRFIGRTGADSEAILKERWGPAFPIQLIRERINHHWDNLVAQHPIPTKPGLIELIDFLDSRGIRKAIATSSRRDNALAKLGPLMARFDLLTKINQTLNRDGSALAQAPTAPEAVS